MICDFKNKSEDFKLGVLAAHNGLRVESLTRGWIADFSGGFAVEFFLLSNDDAEALVVMYDPEEDQITGEREIKERGKPEITNAVLMEFGYGSNEPEYFVAYCFFVVESAPHHISTQYFDKEILRDWLTRGAAEVDSEFDFEAWSKEVGFD